MLAYLHSFALLGCLVLAHITMTIQADTDSNEYVVKAAFLYNLVRLIEWPDENAKPLVMCFLEDDPFGDALNAIKDRTVRERPLEIRRHVTMDEVKSCHLLFISQSSQDHLPDILASVRGLPILTIGDMDSFAERGGMINLVKKEEHIGMEINLRAAQRVQLKISSKLLTLAKIVGDSK